MKETLPTVPGSSSEFGNHTPLYSVALLIAGLWRRVQLKLEGYNPSGSSKDRTAHGLIRDLQTRGLLQESSIVIESTSGNLGVSLANVCSELGCPVTAVIDPKTTSEICGRLLALGARLEMVDEQEDKGGYLLSRLKRVHDLCTESPDYLWTDQYSNPANPDAHYRSTAPEIFSQMNGQVDAIFVAVSTGGTFAGIERYFGEVSPATSVVAVDAVGSVVFGGVPGTRKLTGIGSSRLSSFIHLDRGHHHRMVADRDAFAVCRLLDRDVHLRLGGSSGAVIFACAQALAENREIKDAVCVCADGGKNYESTIFSDDWMVSSGFDPGYRIPIIEAVAVDIGLTNARFGHPRRSC